MTEKKPENPFAFPMSASDGDAAHGYQNGMSLRDYFAAVALQGIIADTKNSQNILISDFLDTAASLSYRAADAMLKARQS